MSPFFHADAKALALTGNSETIYGIGLPDTKSGPVVVEVPPRVLGFLNDQWMRPMGDLGIAGPDQGAGGRYCWSLLDSTATASDGFVQTIRLRYFGSGWCCGRSWGRMEIRARR